jgi:hypothetical protein
VLEVHAPRPGVVAVGVWVQQVVPRMANKLLDNPPTRELRQRVCAGLAGEVLEIGFGSGLNVPHHPDAVVHVAAVEPSDLAWRLAGERLQATAVPVQRSGLDGQSLPPIDELLTGAGFTTVRLDRSYLPKEPRAFGSLYEGVASA